MITVNSTEAMFKTMELTAGGKKIAFLNLLLYTSTALQDFHHLESSNQIICYIIQSRKSEILALIFFPSSQVKSMKWRSLHSSQMSITALSFEHPHRSFNFNFPTK